MWKCWKNDSTVKNSLLYLTLQPSASYLNGAVVLAGRMTAHVACVAAARAALHLHTGRPYQEVGRRGIHLAPGDLVDHRPRLTRRRDRLLH